MRNESIDAGADVEVLLRTLEEDLPRGPEILVKVMAARDAGGIGHVGKDGKGITELHPEGG